MTPEAALIELLERVGAAHGTAVLISDHELDQWPGAAVAAMRTHRLLSKARPASSTVCPGCERECVMPVHILPNTEKNPEAFIVCDKRNDINRVSVQLKQLTQWQCTSEAVCGFINDCLAMQNTSPRLIKANVWEIGIFSGKKHTQMLCLQTDGALVLVVGNNVLPLIDSICYCGGTYSLNSTMVRDLVSSATSADKRHTPSNVKREARKLNTQAMYKYWQQKYREMKKIHPNMSDVWYSQQIAKLDIAQKRKADTIRKHMK